MTKKTNALSNSTGKDTHSYEVKPISNGYIVRHTHSKDGEYNIDETYHEKQPKLSLADPEKLTMKEARGNSEPAPKKSMTKIAPVKPAERQKLTKPTNTPIKN